MQAFVPFMRAAERLHIGTLPCCYRYIFFFLCIWISRSVMSLVFDALPLLQWLGGWTTFLVGLLCRRCLYCFLGDMHLTGIVCVAALSCMCVLLLCVQSIPFYSNGCNVCLRVCDAFILIMYIFSCFCIKQRLNSWTLLNFCFICGVILFFICIQNAPCFVALTYITVLNGE